MNRRSFNNFSSWPKLSYPAPPLLQPARLRLTLSTWYNTIYMCNRFLSKDQFTFFLQTLSTRSKTISICYRFFYQYISKDQIMFFFKLYLPDIILSICVTVFYQRTNLYFFFKLYLPDLILSICVTVFLSNTCQISTDLILTGFQNL